MKYNNSHESGSSTASWKGHIGDTVWIRWLDQTTGLRFRCSISHAWRVREDKVQLNNSVATENFHHEPTLLQTHDRRQGGNLGIAFHSQQFWGGGRWIHILHRLQNNCLSEISIKRAEFHPVGLLRMENITPQFWLCFSLKLELTRSHSFLPFPTLVSDSQGITFTKNLQERIMPRGKSFSLAGS